MFVYYCGFGDKENHCLLKIQSYHRLLQDLQLLQTPPPHPHLDLIFTAHATAHALNYQAYTRALAQAAQETLLQEKVVERVRKMLGVNLRALHDYIMKETDFGSSLGIISPT